MARINIEECWWSDPRRSSLSKMVGSDHIADGLAVQMWRLAQEFWSRDELIPKHIWATIEANGKLIQANLAEEREGGIYVRGSSQYLEWVAERRRAAKAGGKKSAEKRSKIPKQTQANGKQKQPNTNQTQPSGSSSFTTTKGDFENFEASFRQPDLEKLEDLYSQVLARKIGLPQKRQLPRILATFGDPKEFGIWAQGLIASERCPDVGKDRPGFERYFGAALSQRLKGAA